MKFSPQKTKLWRRITLGAIAATFVVGVFSNYAVAAEKVVIGALRFTSHSGGFIALEKGYFKKAGLDVEFKFFQSAQPIAVAVVSGDVDFGIAGITGGLMNLAAKDAVKVVAGVLHEKKGVDGMMIIASKKAYDAGLTSVSKLPGHSVALTQIGSTFHYMSARIAEKSGFPLSDLKLIPLQKVGSMIGAIKSGQVDSMIMVPHISKPLIKAGAAVMLGWLYDYAEYQISALFTSTKNTQKRRKMVKSFVEAYAMGIADFNSVMLNPKASKAAVEDMTKTIHKYVYTTRPYAKAAPSIQKGAMNLNEGARLNLKDVEKQMKWFQKAGLVSSSLTLEQLVDKGFAENY
jgi:NitT/TauT family transport system substrate-binding protein